MPISEFGSFNTNCSTPHKAVRSFAIGSEISNVRGLERNVILKCDEVTPKCDEAMPKGDEISKSTLQVDLLPGGI